MSLIRELRYPVLCVDVGYTTTRAAIASEGRLSSISRAATLKSWRLGVGDGERRRQAWLSSLVELVDTYRTTCPEIGSLAIAFPGAVARDGAIWRENTIWGATATDLDSASVAARTGLPVRIVNDLTAATMRYGRERASEFERFLLVVSVSSGIGAKLYDKRGEEVLLEPRGRNGEIGLALVDSADDALVSRRGLKGVLGNYSSGFSFPVLLRQLSVKQPTEYSASALAQSLRRDGLDIMSCERDLINQIAVRCILDGDRFCCTALGESTRWLARALQGVILYLPPDRIVITGGFASALGDVYLCFLREKLTACFSLLYEPDELAELLVLGACDDLDNLLGLAAVAALAERRDLASTACTGVVA